jgi:hypothetical protein
MDGIFLDVHPIPVIGGFVEFCQKVYNFLAWEFAHSANSTHFLCGVLQSKTPKLSGYAG